MINGHVTLKIFDMSGKEVASLVNEFKQAGYYTVQFNAANLPGGFYMHTLTANNITATTKMTLIK